jgi:hypothetical protein
MYVFYGVVKKRDFCGIQQKIPILPITGIWTHFPMGKLRNTLRKCLLNFFAKIDFRNKKTQFFAEIRSDYNSEK